ncbi:MAG: electron transport complex subunit RsxE [Pseudomonadota bacterium]
MSGTDASASVFGRAVLANNPAWAQLLGLCPLLAVSHTTVNALGLALASAFVVIGSNVTISLLRRVIPDASRLPCFVLIIATFTTATTLLLEAFAYDLYLKIALFVQIIVTNCMILGRAETFASRHSVGQACLDAMGTAIGFAIALLGLGMVRELLGHGTLFAGMELLFGAAAAGWEVQFGTGGAVPLAAYPPGAFIVAALLFAAFQALRRADPAPGASGSTETTQDTDKAESS